MNLQPLLAAAALLAPSFAFAASWELDPSHSSAQFSVRHMMVSNVRGEFGKMSGTLVLDDQDPKRSRVEAVIDASTVNTREPKRDEHLRGPDFFDVANYPTVTFTSTDFRKTGKGRYKVKGDLTLRGVKKAVVLDVEAPEVEVKDPWGNIKRGATATTRIQRKDFGLNWNQALETGGVLVGDEVTITLDLEFNRKAEPAAAAKN